MVKKRKNHALQRGGRIGSGGRIRGFIECRRRRKKKKEKEKKRFGGEEGGGGMVEGMGGGMGSSLKCRGGEGGGFGRRKVRRRRRGEEGVEGRDGVFVFGFFALALIDILAASKEFNS